MGTKMGMKKKKLTYNQLLAKRRKTPRRAIKRAKKTIRKISIKGLEKKLKAILYPLIKKRDGIQCISCRKLITKKMDHHCGHYLKAELCNLIVRYDIRNLNSQCSMCNLWRRGNTIEYRKAMLIKYGEEVVNDLEADYRLPVHIIPRLYLETLIEHYKTIDEL